MRLKKLSGFLLLICLISPIAAIRMVGATAPAITCSCWQIYGTGWTPNTQVTIYWDKLDPNYIIAVTTPNGYGKFCAPLSVDDVSVGTHTIIAVQGSSQATTSYLVCASEPPDARILSPIQNIQNYLQSTLDSDVKAVEAKLDYGGSFYTDVSNWISALSSKIDTVDSDVKVIQNTLGSSGDFYSFVNNGFNSISSSLTSGFTSIAGMLITIQNSLSKVDSDILNVEAKLDEGGSFYNFVGNSFSALSDKMDKVDSDVIAIQNNINNIQLNSMQEIGASSDYSQSLTSGDDITPQNGMAETSSTALYTVTIYALLTHPDSQWIWVQTKMYGNWVQLNLNWATSTDNQGNQLQSATFTVSASGVHITYYDDSADNPGETPPTNGGVFMQVGYSMFIQGAPGTTVTFSTPAGWYG
jgi:hypothetical protein